LAEPILRLAVGILGLLLLVWAIGVIGSFESVPEEPIAKDPIEAVVSSTPGEVLSVDKYGAIHPWTDEDSIMNAAVRKMLVEIDAELFTADEYRLNYWPGVKNVYSWPPQNEAYHLFPVNESEVAPLRATDPKSKKLADLLTWAKSLPNPMQRKHLVGEITSAQQRRDHFLQEEVKSTQAKKRDQRIEELARSLPRP
jgi:hypothetical protein